MIILKNGKKNQSHRRACLDRKSRTLPYCCGKVFLQQNNHYAHSVKEQKKAQYLHAVLAAENCYRTGQNKASVALS